MWVQETKNGKYQFVERYTDFLTGKQKKVSITLDRNTSQSRKMAERALQGKIAKATSSRPQEKKQLTLSELVEAYREDQLQTVKLSTYQRNSGACNSIMKMLGQDVIVDRLTAKYVRDAFIKSGRANSTLNEFLIRFKALIRWGYRADLIKNVAFLDKLERFKDVSHREKIQDKFLESEELEELLDAMTVERWRLFTQFLILSGLRNGEAIALLKSDVDLEDRLIHITKTFDPVNETVTAPKTLCSIRDVYIQDELLDVCKRIKVFTLEDRIKHGRNASELFFEGDKGGHLKYYAYNKYLKETAIRTLHRVITPHTLRHTHASLLMEQGIQVDAISRRLGHENSKITREIYLHVTEKLKEKDNAALRSVRII